MILQKIYFVLHTAKIITCDFNRIDLDAQTTLMCADAKLSKREIWHHEKWT